MDNQEVVQKVDIHNKNEANQEIVRNDVIFDVMLKQMTAKYTKKITYSNRKTHALIAMPVHSTTSSTQNSVVPEFSYTKSGRSLSLMGLPGSSATSFRMKLATETWSLAFTKMPKCPTDRICQVTGVEIRHKLQSAAALLFSIASKGQPQVPKSHGK